MFIDKRKTELEEMYEINSSLPASKDTRIKMQFLKNSYGKNSVDELIREKFDLDNPDFYRIYSKNNDHNPDDFGATISEHASVSQES